jgi:hypothetical protein
MFISRLEIIRGDCDEYSKITVFDPDGLQDTKIIDFDREYLG